ncbi:deoxyhypusine synthase [Flexibacter flexilis DSM 6793]|uniref:Deoxyhypusine synthase-like protein n=1 Tax=Flexibacter flexilis DSM 6793 TaxID=927664 RepID=A0A1I1NJZ0_9BACT|nr:deoxyhypusine synthase [Flexibacter flexilis]SFC97969.1 deoxyhypusine synthase [Flexibacter flexilis DSM 6793]
MNPRKQELLQKTIQHIDIKAHNVVPMVDAMATMAFQARNLSRGAHIFNMMQEDKECAVFLTLAGSLISAGLKNVVVDLVKNNMVDAIVSTGANIVDQDFFEALGFKHYIGTQYGIDDTELRDLMIDRIYDTFIDEEDLRICDDTIGQICNSLEPRPYSSREFIREMGRFLDENDKYAEFRENSIVWQCYKKGVPIFVPAFSDCSAGFGLVHHQWHNPTKHVSIDSAKDFLEITKVKLHNPESGLFMIGGGVPKNFVQDIVVACDILEKEAPMHKYAVQITVADERDGALSGSTLKEACSWGKVDVVYEQMVWAEATIAMPLIAGYAYHKGSQAGRPERRFNDVLDKVNVPA